ncbi:MAG: alpha-amylase family glycosyl hydrolase, partial [Ginsengibacter sp.]
MFKYTFSLIVFLFVCFGSFAQKNIDVYPTNWWVEMKNPELQLMLHGTEIVKNGNYTIDYPGVTIKKIHKVSNPNYIFIDLVIEENAKPGILKIKAGKYVLPFELKSRREGNGSQFAQGVNSSDLMYLIMPDRFSNGDESNDRVPGMRDQSLNRDSIYHRHGGDLKGIQNQLDYLKSLGVTSIWLNPIIENDMPDRTEHGYAFTNHYKVDRRIGGPKAYKELIDAVHKKGMKMIQDAVYNHIGKFHFTVLDPPMDNWLNHWPKYTQTTYKEQVLFDPYASKNQIKQMSDGWFVPSMPDLNHKNSYVEKYLIQHAIWTIEEFGIDGWRIDTYAYNDLDFMNRCNQALMDEYPKLTMFGETWVHGVINQSYFCENNFDIPFKSNLQAVTDFQTLWGITDALTKDFGWNDGVNRLYTTLAQDLVYKDPMRNVIFLDNHDISRFFSVVGEDTLKYKAGLSWLLTSRGIPQLYYGAEIGMTGITSPHDGFLREDFPGGWKSDQMNKFIPAGRTAREEGIWRHISTLA